jgi:prevent-host-death family protein
MDAQRKGAEEARNQLPDLLDAAENGQATVITRHGKPVAALVPMKDYVRSARQLSILDLEGSGRGLWGKDSTATIRKMRDEWDR